MIKLKSYEIVAGVILFIIFLFFVRRTDKKVADLHVEYPKLEYSDSISGIITNRFIPNFGTKSPGAVFVKIDSSKYFINVQTLNISREYYLDEYLKIGDSIYKPSFCNEISLYDKTRNPKFTYTLRDK